MEHNINVYISMYASFEVRVTHLTHKNRRTVDASYFCPTLAAAKQAILDLQKKYSVSDDRTWCDFAENFWKV